MVKAMGLFSGGLDSLLAVRVLQEQGIEVVAVNFVTPFFGPRRASEGARRLGIPLRVVDITEEHLRMLRRPRHGYGSQMNPCIDCHSLMLRKARELMEGEGASFLFTGEVLGQRPFSQTKEALRTVDEEAGVVGLVLRPLSARLLSPTLPEREGWVRREALLGIRGRSRRRQMELAKKYGIEGYPSPAGGCLLTDPVYARRLKDLFEHQEEVGRRDLELLKVGRHLRLSPRVKAIVGRNQGENEKIASLAISEDLILQARDYPGPVVLIPYGGEEELLRAAGVCLRWSDAPSQEVSKVIWRKGNRTGEVEAAPISPDECERLLL